jgi:uncharacterized protein (UPF0335 family)
MWVHKVEALEKEKKVLTDEISHLVRVTTQRENQLKNEIKSNSA